MSLRKRVLVYFVITNVVLIIIFILIIKFFIISSLERQRELYEKKIIVRTEKVLYDYFENYYIMSYNWGEWDSMHNFVSSPSEEFIKNNFPAETFGWDFLDFLVIKNLSNKTLYSAFLNPKTGKFDDYKKLGIEKHTEKIIKELIKNFPKEEDRTYFFKTEYGVILTIFQVITTNKVENPNGVLILGGIIGKPFENQLKSFLLEDVKVYYAGDKEFEKIESQILEAKQRSKRVKKISSTLYYIIQDYKDDPAVIIKISYDDGVFKILNSPLFTSFIMVIVWWIVLGLFLYFLIDRFITKRILKIADYMNLIKETKNLDKKVEEDSLKDEISCLVRNINRAVEELRKEKEEREKAEKQMIVSEKLAVIGKLASVLSHELNSPLLAISNSIEVLKNSCKIKDSENLKALVEITEREVKYIRELIDGLLAIHKKKLKKFKFFDIGELIKESLELLKITKRIGKVKIEILVNDNCKVYGSPSELKQVFLNFLINSIEAMEGEGRIEVKSRAEGRYCLIEIIDDGPGLSSEVKNNLFEPFLFSDKKEGIGLGLYVSYKIIKRHRGEISYLDDKTGAHFIIKLPMFKYKGGLE